MTTTISSGAMRLVRAVRTYLDNAGVTAEVALGWRERTKQVNQGPGRANRITFTPSDDSGKGGRIVATQQPGQRDFGGANERTSVRPLYDWERVFVVSIWAIDKTNPNDDERQIEAVEDLFEWVMRAVHASGFNNARWGDAIWTVSPLEHQFGRELRVSLTFQHPLFDVPNDVVFPQHAITPVLGDE